MASYKKPPSPFESPFKSLPPLSIYRDEKKGREGRKNNETTLFFTSLKIPRIVTESTRPETISDRYNEFLPRNAYRFRIPIAENEATFLWI